MDIRHGWVGVVLATVLVVFGAGTRYDRWVKHHNEIRFDGVRQAEYTSISYLGEPGISTLLYRDAAGENLVIRRFVQKGVRSGSSIELLRTGEKLIAEAGLASRRAAERLQRRESQGVQVGRVHTVRLGERRGLPCDEL